MKTRISNIVLAASFSALAIASSATAAISGVSGATTWLGTPPAACVPTSLTGPNAYAWDEQQNVPVAGLFVNGANNPFPNPGAAIPGILNTIVDSHLIHFEDFSGLPSAVGTVTYTQPIIGVIFLSNDLSATDAMLGSFGTLYPTGFPFRDYTTNSSTFSVSGNTISFDLNTHSPVLGVMQLRVLTAVPTPGAAALAGLAGIAALRRRRTMA